MRKVEPHEKGLQRLREQGLLIWRDPRPLPPSLFGENCHRNVSLGSRRHDFTEAVLQKWARAGNLYVRIKK